MQDLPPPRIEERIRIEPDGTVLALSGKVEFGQGIRTAFAQIVAEELDVPVDRVRVVLGDTALVPFDHGTFGSRSIAVDGAVLRRAAAAVRHELLGRAAKRLGLPAEGLTTSNGAVHGGAQTLSYVELAGGDLAGPVPDDVPPRPTSTRATTGAVPRVESRDIVTGRARYVADLRLPGMLRGAVVHPPVRGSKLVSLDEAGAAKMPGVVRVVRDGDFVGIVAEREEQARAAIGALVAEWETPPARTPETLDIPMKHEGDVEAALASAATRLDASYTLPFISNAPIGPSAAVADARDGGITVYAGTQRPFPLRDEVAAATGIAAERVRVIPLMPSGTYGRNSTNDAALEAARLSSAIGRPVHVQWTREDEFALAPVRPAAYLEASAGLSKDGKVVAWKYQEHTNSHGSGQAFMNPRVAPHTSGRNAVPPYTFPVVSVDLHVEPTPVRTAAFRSLAAAENVFAIESLMDELAHAAGADPLAFRLAHVDDPRLVRVLELVAERSGWSKRSDGAGSGLGLACTVYHGTYVAHVAQVSVATNGRVRLERVWAAIDPGRVVSADGVRNQTEGGIQQSASWTLLEELRHRDGRITTTGWDSYPIASFVDAPASIEVIVANDETKESTGVGEPGMVPVAAAIANAVFNACGARVRELPITRERVRAAKR